MSEIQTTNPNTKLDLHKPNDRRAWLEGLAQEKLASLLPRHVPQETFVRVVLAEFARSPKLSDCTPLSLSLSLLTAAQFGLVPSGPMGHAYLIPRWSSKLKAQECTLLIGYKGLCQLVRNSGDVSTLHAECVYVGDEFDVRGGTDPQIVHKPDVRGDKSNSKIVASYATARMKDGSVAFAWCSIGEIEARRQRGASGQDKSTPWDTDYAAMARKSALRKLLTGGTVPLSSEIATLLHAEDERERANVIDATPVKARSLAAALAAPVDPPQIDEPVEVPTTDELLAMLGSAACIRDAEALVTLEHAKWDDTTRAEIHEAIRSGSLGTMTTTDTHTSK